MGFPAIELACTTPHFSLTLAEEAPGEVASRIRDSGLAVSAFSLFTDLTHPESLDAEVASAETYIHLASTFDTDLIKITPGSPSSLEAGEGHWRSLQEGLGRLAEVAGEVGVRLAVETHMRQLTDTLASCQRLLEIASDVTIGLTLDVSNLSFAGERMSEVIPLLGSRIYHTHIKNGLIDEGENWRFLALDQGLTDYAEVLPLLRDSGFDGYLSLECLSDDTRRNPVPTVTRDLDLLRCYLHSIDWEPSR